jgi:hypothetical protein
MFRSATVDSTAAHEDHIRRLLDQRAARAGPDTRLAFDSLSVLSDSPSIYSRQFSPRATHGDYPVAAASPRRSQGHAYPEPKSPVSVMSDRERLADPTASGIDMEDSSDSLSDTYDDAEDGQSTVEAGEAEPRMSYLGPKMKVHSKAPWEVDDDDVDSDTSSHFRGSSSHKRTKTKTSKGDGIMKGLGFMGRNGPRPSGESSRSSSSGNKKSFETSSSISAGGALQYVHCRRTSF